MADGRLPCADWYHRGVTDPSGVAQWQSSGLLIRWLWVQVPPPEPHPRTFLVATGHFITTHSPRSEAIPLAPFTGIQCSSSRLACFLTSRLIGGSFILVWDA